MISNADFVDQGRDKNFWLILLAGLVLWLISVLIVRFWSKKLGQNALMKEDGANFLRSLNEAKKEGGKNPEAKKDNKKTENLF